MNGMLDSSPSTAFPLDQVGDVHGHFLDLSRVELLDVSHHSDVFGSDKVDCNTRLLIDSKREYTLYVRNVLHVRFGGCSFHGWRGDHS